MSVRQATYQCRVAHASGGDDPAERPSRLVNPLLRALDGGGDALRVGDIHGEELGPRRPAQLLHQLGAGILVQVEDGYVAAFLVQLDGRCAAEAGCPVEAVARLASNGHCWGVFEDRLRGQDGVVGVGSVLHVIGL